MLYLGLMSGTSLDGLDMALCSFERGSKGLKYQLLKSKWLPYDKDWEELLRNAVHLHGHELTRLDRDYGRFLGEQVNLFLNQIDRSEGVLIGSHGHTVFHTPNKGVTVQIGHGPSLAAAAGWPTINDFRSADVALGGQGAPLVPIFDRDFLSDYTACLNLGGFANATILTGEQITAFDISYCNTVLNDLISEIGMSFDVDGALARSGKVIPQMLAELNDLHFYKLPPPKSLGREFVSQDVEPILRRHTPQPLADRLATITEHIAWAIGQSLGYLPVNGKILASGGGAFNEFLMERIAAHLPNQNLTKADKIFVSFKEAIAFAYLAYLFDHRIPANIPSVTGASKPTILGSYHP